MKLWHWLIKFYRFRAHNSIFKNETMVSFPPGSLCKIPSWIVIIHVMPMILNRQVPCISHPVSSLANILLYHMTFVKTKKPTLTHYYYVKLQELIQIIIFQLRSFCSYTIQSRMQDCTYLSCLLSLL